MYTSLEEYQSENMMIFGHSRNVMIISYQKAALKLFTRDRRFMEFLSKVCYAIFDEAHYLIDDSPFNKGINIIANDLLFSSSQQFHPYSNFPIMTYIPNAIKIFMSGTMEELLVYLQKWVPYYRINEKWGYNSKPKGVPPLNPETAHAGDPKSCQEMANISYMYELNSVLIIPTDHSYINPFVYRDYKNLIPQIGKNSKKWLIFVNTLAQGEELKAKLNSKYGENTAVFIHAQIERI